MLIVSVKLMIDGVRAGVFCWEKSGEGAGEVRVKKLEKN